ncbi:MAG: twin-arginine translocation signal domain-containing protein, partial [Deltaproteobacteria bacterium]
MKPISRRKFLKASAAMAAGYGLLSGFKGRPDRARPDVPIDTIVILMMENRSFDQMFGSLSLEEGRSDV